MLRIVAAHTVTSIDTAPQVVGRRQHSSARHAPGMAVRFVFALLRRRSRTGVPRIKSGVGGYAASPLRLCRLRSCGSRKRFLMRTTFGVTSTSSSSWM